jgi:hypothetical protein
LRRAAGLLTRAEATRSGALTALIAPYIVTLLGIVMFGMGLTISLDDFKEVAKRPYEVGIGSGTTFPARCLPIALHPVRKTGVASRRSASADRETCLE